MTRIGVLTQWYEPEEGSAAIPSMFARSLASLGNEVEVLTGFPNYPSGRLYPGYRLRPYQVERRDGIRVHRVPLIPSHDRSAVRRAANYLSFATSAAVRLDLLRKVDVWLVCSSPATVALPAMLGNMLLRRPYVLHIFDMWPDTVLESGFIQAGRSLTTLGRVLHRFCDATYRRASAVSVSSPGMAELLARRGVAAEKVTFVPNWVDEKVFCPVERDHSLARRLGLTGFVVMYAGYFGDFQHLDTAVEAMGLLTDLPDVKLALVGSGVAEQRLRDLAARHAPGRVIFLGQQPVERMASLLAIGDLQLVSLGDQPLMRVTLPSKVQVTLAAGRPILGTVDGDARRIIEDSRAGLAVAPGDVTAIANAIRQVHAMRPADRELLGARGREYYLEVLAERVGSAALSQLLNEAAQCPRPGSDRVSSRSNA